LLLTGGVSSGGPRRRALKKAREHEAVDEIEEELHGPSIPKKKIVKKPATKDLSASKMPEPQFLDTRKRDAYSTDRANLLPKYRGNDPYFHNVFQAQCYSEILHRKAEKNVVPQKWIDIDHMSRHPEYFGEAMAICQEFGLIPLMQLKQDYDEALVCQFLATVHFGTEAEDPYLTWMSNDQQITETWADITAMLGFENHGTQTILPSHLSSTWFRVHEAVRPVENEALRPLYFWQKFTLGKSEGLYPPYDIMHRIYRSVLNPKVGNLDEIHGFLRTLMVMTHQFKTKGKKLDIADFIWNELFHVILNKKNACHGPLIMKIILWAWEHRFPTVGVSSPKTWIEHKPKRLLIKDHSEKHKEDKAKDKAAGAAAETAAGPSRAPRMEGNFAWMARQMKKIFCMSKAVENRTWQNHKEDKLARQRDIQRRRDQGEDVLSGSEKNITSWSKWQAKDENGNIIVWSDFEGEEEVSSRRRPRPGSNENLSD